VETDSIPQQTHEVPQQIDSADLVVGILTELDSDAISRMCGALQSLPGPARIAILQHDTRNSPAELELVAAPDAPSIFFAPSLLTNPDGPGAGPLSMASTYKSVFAAGEKLQSRGCCIIASKHESSGAHWASELARPMLEQNFDLVVPRYAQHRFDGLLNSCIIAPLIRSLYGRRLHNPMGPDFGVSRRLFQKLLGSDRSGKSGGNGLHPLASLAPAAVCENLSVAEVHFGARVYPPPDWTNTSSILAEALGPVFQDMERNASCWQRTRVSASVLAIGQPPRVREDTGTVDVGRLVESFQLGNRALQEIWALVLPPYTLLELKKLSRFTAEQFRMPDDLWVRIVYDFALAHRLRTINRDHLLKSMTPLYLGWVASYARDMQADDSITPDERLERLALAFEAEKPYLVSRWRWPDRFNP
jgi:glucosylglycerate synthase